MNSLISCQNMCDVADNKYEKCWYKIMFDLLEKFIYKKYNGFDYASDKGREYVLLDRIFNH